MEKLVTYNGRKLIVYDIPTAHSLHEIIYFPNEKNVSNNNISTLYYNGNGKYLEAKPFPHQIIAAKKAIKKIQDLYNNNARKTSSLNYSNELGGNISGIAIPVQVVQLSNEKGFGLKMVYVGKTGMPSILTVKMSPRH